MIYFILIKFHELTQTIFMVTEIQTIITHMYYISNYGNSSCGPTLESR